MPPTRYLPSDFGHSAAYPLYACDPVQDRGWALHFDHEDYRRTSFLDGRALQRQDIGGWMFDRRELALAFVDPAPAISVHWLFHIGHCGSTLVSRLLDLLPGTLGIREPLPLLQLAHAQGMANAEDWLTLAARALARGFDDTRAVIVKPTSLVTVLADGLLARSDGQAVLLWLDLATWLATMLRYAGLCRSVLETEALRLHEQAPLPETNSEGERLARIWLAEQARWRRLRQGGRHNRRLFDLDFATVLADPAAATANLADRFGLDVPADWARRIELSGLLSHYAKIPGQRYDAELRRRELDDAAASHAGEIDRGIAWAERAVVRLDLEDLRMRLRPAK